MASGFEFWLDQGGGIRGRVTRESDGQPIANLWVEAHHYDSNAWGNGANTDDDGFYEIIGLPSDDYRIFIYPEGMNFLEEYYDDSHDYNTANRVAVSAGQTTSNIDMALDYGFDHDASVMNIHQPDGTFQTYYSFYPYGFVGDPLR